MVPKKKSYISPILSFDFHLENYHKLLKKLKVENDLKQLGFLLKRSIDSSIQEVLETTDYEALVVTDANREIVWADNGFKEMTGYAKDFAIGKHPTFLHGTNTSEATRDEIRQLLKEEKRFKAAITNYRKNGEEYQCQIDVLPLYDSENRLTHFLAMEREKKVA